MRLDDLFNIYNGLASSNVQVFQNSFENSVMYVRPASTMQKTVAGYVEKSDTIKKKIFPKDTLFVSTDGEGSHSYSYVSTCDFVPNSNVAALIPKVELTLHQKLFYAMIITKNRYRFSYGRKPKGDRLASINIPSLDEIPVWLDEVDLNPFRGAEEPTFDELIALPVVKELKRLDEIFDIQNGIAATKLVEFDTPQKGCVPYIRPASTQNRTLRSFIDRKSVDKKHIFPKHTLFVSTNGEGSHSYSYVSTFPMVANSDVAVLTPKQTNMPMEVKLYYAKCITANRYLFSYGRKPKGEKLKSIKLPYFADDADFEYIKKFIHSLPFSSRL